MFAVPCGRAKRGVATRRASFVQPCQRASGPTGQTGEHSKFHDDVHLDVSSERIVGKLGTRWKRRYDTIDTRNERVPALTRSAFDRRDVFSRRIAPMDSRPPSIPVTEAFSEDRSVALRLGRDSSGSEDSFSKTNSTRISDKELRFTLYRLID